MVEGFEKDDRIEDKMFLVSEIFESIQGEGEFAGYPSLFIRLCYCHRKCEFCDTEFDTVNKRMSYLDMKRRIEKYKGRLIVWTGGEPLLHWKQISGLKLMVNTPHEWHVETAGDFINRNGGLTLSSLFRVFDHVVVSPKCLVTAKKVAEYRHSWGVRVERNTEIKVVTDLRKTNLDLIPYATCLMPLSTHDPVETNMIKKDVIEYCIEKNLLYSPRLQVDIWGYEARGV